MHVNIAVYDYCYTGAYKWEWLNMMLPLSSCSEKGNKPGLFLLYFKFCIKHEFNGCLVKKTVQILKIKRKKYIKTLNRYSMKGHLKKKNDNNTICLC